MGKETPGNVLSKILRQAKPATTQSGRTHRAPRLYGDDSGGDGGGGEDLPPSGLDDRRQAAEEELVPPLQ